MAELVEKTLDVVGALQLQLLEEDWVTACWDNYFLDLTPLPLAAENLLQEEGYFLEQLEQLHGIANQWEDVQSESDNEGSGFWTCLLENNMFHKALVALLAYLIPMDFNSKALRGQKKEAAFVAATTYLSLIGLPGRHSFRVYSPDLLLRAADMLKAHSAMGTTEPQKRGNQNVTASQKGKARKRGRNTTHRAPSLSQNSLDGDEEENMSEEDEEELTLGRVERFRSLYVGLLSELVRVLESVSLRESLQTADHILKVLAAVTRQDNHNFDGRFPIVAPTGRQGQRLGVAALAFKGILQLCQPLHGDVTALSTATCKYLLPNALMLLDGNKVVDGQTLPQVLQLGRSHTIAFIKYMLKELGEACLVSVKILLQHMCMKVPDKTEYRGKAAQAVVTILQEFPDERYAFMLKWIGVLSRNEKSPVRLFSLEIIALLLGKPERELTGVTEEQAALASHVVLINRLLDRCSDVSAAVRTRAITGFAQCLEPGSVSVRKTILEMITPRHAPTNQPRLVPTPGEGPRTAEQTDRTVNETEQDNTENGESSNHGDDTPLQTPSANSHRTPFRSVELTPGLNNSLPDRQGVISMLQRRAREDKANVRKAALHTLHKFILFEAPAVNTENVAVLCVRCRDQALSVRKQAIMSLTEVLSQFQTNPDVQSAWLKGVVPTVWDQETSIQDKCVDILDTVILSNVVPAHRTKSADHLMAWELLTLISKPDNTDLRRSLKKVCRLWERQKKLTTSLISAIFSHIGTRNNQAAWSFLSDVCMSKVKVDMKPVVKYWTDHHHTITGETEGDVWENVLRIIGLNAPAIASDLQLQLIDEFKEHLLRFDLQTGLVSALASAASQLSKARPGVTFASGQEWGRDVLVACDHHLSAIVLDEDSSSDVPCDETKTMCYLFTLGVVALHCPSLTPKRAAMLVQSFVAAPCITDEGDQTDSLTSASQPVNSSQGSEVSAEGSQGSQRSQVTQNSQGTQFTQLSQFRGCKMSGPVRAIAFLTLGKLCLQDKAVAKKCVPAMARELDISTSEASDMVRNNIVVILRDLCVRYATLVDPYLPVVATCLRDPAPIVRRQTLELLTGLLQEDYLKWKGALFFRFMVTLLDPHPDIVAFAEYCLGIHLMKRHPTMMSQHLLESIFVFNDYTKHNVFNKYTQSEREKLLFSLKGKENHSQRMKLYRFMLEHMEDEHRFPLMAKISQEVLGAVVDGDVVYDEESCQLLQDALAILSCKEIKLTSLRSTRSVEDASDEMEMATVVMATAKKTLLTQVVKKNLKDEVIPIVLSLKHRLERERSPLLKDLMLFFRELMKDFKNEIKDILSEDKQLACEVEYDLRQFDKQQTEGAEQGQATPAAATPVQTANGSGTPAAGQPQSKPSTPQVGSARKNAPTPVAGKTTPVPARRDSSDTAGPNGAASSSQTDIAKATRHVVMQMMENHKRRLSSGGEDQERQRRRLSMVKLSENVLSSSGQENSDSTPEKQKTPQRAQTGRRPEIAGQQQTPQQRRRPLRAISTPSGLLGNVTFAGESNMTLPLVPPSPIAGHTKSPDEDTSAEEVNIVYMDMPGVGQSKPREWHVKVKSEEQVEEMAQPVVVTSPVVSRSRRSRRSNKSSS